MKIAIVTDAWRPQINGVVITLERTAECLRKMGHQVDFVTAEGLATFPLPGYPSIRLAWFPTRHVTQELDRLQPDAIHISTEGPLGSAARKYCLDRKFPFTTCYHTRFPEYVRARVPVPLAWGYAWMRRFHSPATHMLVATKSLRDELQARGFHNLALWERGVNTELFKPRDKDFLKEPRPIFMFMGRVAVEKNIEAFLDLELPGTKYVVGDGPDLPQLQKHYPDVKFTGFKVGEELATYVAAADVFVFPSRTDTFGLVLLEAMACGVPVAAYPVTGPRDVIQPGVTGYCDEDLAQAAIACLDLKPAACRAYALAHSWEAAAAQFLEHITPLHAEAGRRTG